MSYSNVAFTDVHAHVYNGLYSYVIVVLIIITVKYQ